MIKQDINTNKSKENTKLGTNAVIEIDNLLHLA